MMWKKHKSSPWPTPLRERNGNLGKVVRDYVQNTEETRGEAAAFARVLARAAGPDASRRSLRLPILCAGLVAGLAVALVAVPAVLSHREIGATKEMAAPRTVSPPTVATISPAAQPSVDKASPSAVRPSGPPAGAPAKIAAVRLREQPSALPAGMVDLDGQATASLSDDAVASGRAQNQDTEIVLRKGSIDLRVLARAKGHGFAVRAGLYQFTVVGTAFTVSQSRSRLELVVREGKVAVSRGTTRLATVAAGGTWSVDMNPALAVAPLVATSPLASAPAPAPIWTAPPLVPSPTLARAETSPLVAPALAPTAAPLAPPALAATPTAAPLGAPAVAASPQRPPLAAVAGTHPTRATAPETAAPPRRDCGELAASKRTREALVCYQEQAAQGGLAGETAQYELARLWRDSLGEPERAVAAFKDQRSRFPRGALRTEADLSIIELLPRLGRHTEVMAETEQFLNAHPKTERRGEIHLLRGNVLREVLHDFQQAEREYARGTESGGKVGDDCRFLRAACLEALGRVEEARTAYEAYLLQNQGTHVEDAKKRLARLRP